MAQPLIGYRIRERRRQLGLTQAGTAKQLGISASYLNLIEANKRTIAGATLRRIADILHLDPEALTGRAEQRMIDDLVELATEPMLREFNLDKASAGDLVGRHRAWATAMLACWRAYRDQAETAAALTDRLHLDPALAEAVHRMLTHVTAVKSAAEILETTRDLDAKSAQRFHTILTAESTRLSEVVKALVADFDRPYALARPITEAEEVDDFIIERNNYFPALEEAAEALAAPVRRHGEMLLSALPGYLAKVHGVSVASGAQQAAGGVRFHNLCAYRADTRTLMFLDHASVATRQFQMARLAAELGAREAIEKELDHPQLTSPASRALAFRALASYVAGALMFPYERFHADAVAMRYDVEVLRQRYGGSFEQVAHRLVTLRKPGREGIPFGFLRTNIAGFTTKRFPLPDLPLPRHGHACPLWAIYGAFQASGRVVRQLVRFPDNARYLFVASTVTKQPATFHEPPMSHAVMLACDVMHADRTVYADGLDFGSASPATVSVGPSCLLCPRLDCQHRAEEPLVGRFAR